MAWHSAVWWVCAGGSIAAVSTGSDAVGVSPVYADSGTVKPAGVHASPIEVWVDMADVGDHARTASEEERDRELDDAAGQGDAVGAGRRETCLPRSSQHSPVTPSIHAQGRLTGMRSTVRHRLDSHRQTDETRGVSMDETPVRAGTAAREKGRNP